MHSEDISLSRTLDHTHGITAIDSLQQAVTLYIIAVFLHLVGAIVHVVGTCRLQVYVVDAEHLSVDIDVYVHCSIGAGRKLDGFAVLDGIAAIDSIMSVQALGHVGKIFLIALRVLLVTAIVVILLNAEHIHLLLLHFCEDVLCDET